MRYLIALLLVGCASVKSVRDEPFIDIDIDGQPRIVHTLDSASEIVETPDLLGAGDALGVDTVYDMEEQGILFGLGNYPFYVYIGWFLILSISVYLFWKDIVKHYFTRS